MSSRPAPGVDYTKCRITSLVGQAKASEQGSTEACNYPAEWSRGQGALPTDRWILRPNPQLCPPSSPPSRHLDVSDPYERITDPN